MKNLIAALVVCVALATTSFDADAAKRFGGGASFGKAAPTFSQRAPTAAPAAPSANQAQPAQGGTGTNTSTKTVHDAQCAWWYRCCAWYYCTLESSRY